MVIMLHEVLELDFNNSWNCQRLLQRSMKYALILRQCIFARMLIKYALLVLHIAGKW